MSYINNDSEIWNGETHELEEVIFAPEEIARMEIRVFVNEGLKDVQEDNLYDFDEIFDEIESR